MAGIVFEGGTFRGMFSAGVMDALLENKLHFYYVIGVSAGITYGISYVSNQQGRNIDILRKYRNDPRYCSIHNIPKHRSLFDVDFLYDEIPNKLNILDTEAIQNFEGKVIAVTTDALSGEAVYMNAKDIDNISNILKASCAIPFYFPPIYIDGKRYFDGGLSDSIPIKKSIADGNKKNLVVLTQPKGYRKKLSNSYKLAAFLLRKTYPNLAKLFYTRSTMYNETIEYIQNLEENTPNDIVVLRPNYKIKSFESKVSKIEEAHQHGYDTAIKNIDKIKKLLED